MIDPVTKKRVSKGFLHQAHKICSEKCIEEQTQFLIDIFIENGYNTTLLENWSIGQTHPNNSSAFCA